MWKLGGELYAKSLAEKKKNQGDGFFGMQETNSTLIRFSGL